MKLLLGDPLIKALNPCLVLDEGLASGATSDSIPVYFAERKIWWLKVTATGAVGHGSRFVEGTAVAKLMRVVNHVLEFRQAQLAELEGACGCGKTLGDVTTMNCTLLHAGDTSRYQFNVIPASATAGFDCRISCTQDLPAFQERVAGWCSEPGVSWELVNGTGELGLQHAVSQPEGPAWELFQRAVAAAGVTLEPPSSFPAATDSRWVRLVLGTPCFGFSPMPRTPVLLHDHDEHVSVDTFLAGIRVYEAMIPVLAAGGGPALRGVE